MSKSKSLSWNDRFALLDRYNPSDEEACEVFGVSTDELQTARELRSTGTFVPSPHIDVDSYGNLFTNTDNSNTKSMTSHKKPEKNITGKPLSASKEKRAPKKRGRKGDKIQKAFASIPSTPTNAERFAKEYGVSIAVLRQSKRFDKTGLSPVHVKKDSETKELMIWREDS